VSRPGWAFAGNDLYAGFAQALCEPYQFGGKQHGARGDILAVGVQRRADSLRHSVRLRG